jgi:hypothetical protein
VILIKSGLTPLGMLACNTQAPDEGNMYLIGKVGSPDLKERFLTPLVSGRARSAFFMTEPAELNGAGADPSMMITTCSKDGNHWVINGKKCFITGAEGGDPAAIVFDAVRAATDQGIDTLIVDTAGRLHNKRELMDELAKVRRVLGRINPEAPHDVVLVLDATNGQNALQQIEIFKEVAGVTGLIMTKLDGTARGGVLVAAAQQYGLPIHAIGVGEKIDDLRAFDPDLVAQVIAGVAR